MTLIPRDTTTGRVQRTAAKATEDLHRQVAHLINPSRQRFTRDGGRVEHVTVPSLWQQLHAALGNSRSLTTGGGRPGSKLPLNPVLVDLITEVTVGVNQLVREHGLTARRRTAGTEPATTGLRPLPAARHTPVHAEDREPLHDPQLVGQLAERIASTSTTGIDRANLARIYADTPANLRQVALAVAAHRDVALIDRVADRIHSWVTHAETALVVGEEGTETRGLRGFPCPDCRTTWVTRDTDGDDVREPALVAVFREHLVRHFTCRRCGALWWRGTDIEQLTAAATTWRNPVPVHHITWTIEREHVQGAFTCTAPPGADCRAICPQGCEAWPCGHKLIDGGQCNVLSWLGLSDPAEVYAGDPEPLRSGPIDTTWDGAAILWSYAEPAAVDQAGAEDPSVQITRQAVSA